MGRYALKCNQLLILMHQNYISNLVLIFALAFVLACQKQKQKFAIAKTNRHFDKTVIISKNIILLLFTYWGCFVNRNAMGSPNFFYKNCFSRFWDISKKRSKKKNPLFSCTITILDDTYTMHARVPSHPLSRISETPL